MRLHGGLVCRTQDVPAGLAALASACMLVSDGNRDCLVELLRPGRLQRLAYALCDAAADLSRLFVAHPEEAAGITTPARSLRHWRERALVLAAGALAGPSWRRAHHPPTPPHTHTQTLCPGPYTHARVTRSLNSGHQSFT